MIEWPLPLRSISATSLGTFGRCPEQFRRSYLLGEKRAPAAAAIIGNGVHGAQEANFSQKISSHKDLPAEDVKEAYAETFDQQVERSGGSSEIDWSMKVGREKVILRPGEAKDRGIPLAMKYLEKIAPSIQPIGSEEWFNLRVAGVPVPIKGKIDVIDADSKKDMKFGATAKKTVDVTWLVQGYIYLLVNETTDREGNVRVPNLGEHRFEWHTGSWGSERYGPTLHTASTAPGLGMARDSRTMLIGAALMRNAASAIASYWNTFGPDEPWPGALSHPWACGFCGFKPTCSWWTVQGGRTLL